VPGTGFCCGCTAASIGKASKAFDFVPLLQVGLHIQLIQAYANGVGFGGSWLQKNQSGTGKSGGTSLTLRLK